MTATRTGVLATTVAVRRSVFEQRDLAEEVSGPERRERLAVLRHLDLPFEDDEELVREPALLEQHEYPAGRSTESAHRAICSRSAVPKIGEQRMRCEVVVRPRPHRATAEHRAPPAPC